MTPEQTWNNLIQLLESPIPTISIREKFLLKSLEFLKNNFSELKDHKVPKSKK